MANEPERIMDRYPWYAWLCIFALLSALAALLGWWAGWDQVIPNVVATFVAAVIAGIFAWVVHLITPWVSAIARRRWPDGR
jgi:Ni/Fe-hydrogenase subunit HybB-like protein